MTLHSDGVESRSRELHGVDTEITPHVYTDEQYHKIDTQFENYTERLIGAHPYIEPLLTQLQERYPEAYTHSKDTARIAYHIARECLRNAKGEVDENVLAKVVVAALLHDVGKADQEVIDVVHSDEIIPKDPAHPKRRIINSHGPRGAEMLERLMNEIGVDSSSRDVADTALYVQRHHQQITVSSDRIGNEHDKLKYQINGIVSVADMLNAMCDRGRLYKRQSRSGQDRQIDGTDGTIDPYHLHSELMENFETETFMGVPMARFIEVGLGLEQTRLRIDDEKALQDKIAQSAITGTM